MEKLTLETVPNAIYEIASELSEIKKLLLSKAEPRPDEMLSVQQAATYLNLAVPTLYGYVQRSAIPVCKRPGTKRLYFSRQELTNWILSGRRMTLSEIEQAPEQLLKPIKKRR